MIETVGWWFRQHYRLPPTDARYLDMTPEDLLAEYWAFQYASNPNKEVWEDDDFNMDDVMAEAEARSREYEQAIAESAPEDWEEVKLGGH